MAINLDVSTVADDVDEAMLIPAPTDLVGLLPEYATLLSHVCGKKLTQKQLLRRITCFHSGWMDRGNLSDEVIAGVIWSKTIS